MIFWGATEGSAVNGNNAWQLNYQLGSQGTFNTGLSKRLIDDYLCTDGKPIAVSPLYQGDDSMNHVVASRDPRLRQTIFLPGDTVIVSNPDVTFTYPALLVGSSLAGSSRCTTGYQLYKGLNTDPRQSPINYSSPHATDGVIYMRYAEVLLIYAEAKAELGTITQADLDESINLLRDRVSMPHLILSNITPDPNWEFRSLSPIINEIRRERRVELACEGFRFDDIFRWAAAGTLLVGWQPLGAQVHQYLTVNLAPSGTGSDYLHVGINIFADNKGYIEPYQNVSAMSNGYKFDVNRDYLLPIDQQDINLNPKLQQNPGW